MYFLQPFFDTTMNKYNPHFFCWLDNGIHHQSNNTSCTPFRKDFEFSFRYGGPLFFSVLAWYMPEFAASSKNIAKDRRTSSVWRMLD